MNVHVFETTWTERSDALRRVREIVFIDEQGVPREEEWDGLDEGARHFVAIEESGAVVGTARLLPTGQIGRMAVLPQHRGRGLGRRLLDAAVDAAARAGADRVFLHAQTHAVPFYRKAGFDVEGDEFVEAGIPHRHMVRLLPIAFKPPAAGARATPEVRQEAPSTRAPGRLTTFADETSCRDALDSLLQTAERSVCIVSPTLDVRLFGTPDCVELLSRFARRAAVPNVRILVEDVRAIAESGHRLLELARRLPSKIALRRLPDEVPEEVMRNFVVVDERGYWVVPDRESWSGFCNDNDRVEARRLVDEFDRLFDRSRDDPELRSTPI